MNSFPPCCHPRTGRSPGCSARDENPILGLAPGWRAARGQLCLGTKCFHPQTRSSLPLAPATRTQPIDFQRGISLPCALNCYNLLPRHESLWRGALDYAPCPVPSQALPQVLPAPACCISLHHSLTAHLAAVSYGETSCHGVNTTKVQRSSQASHHCHPLPLTYLCLSFLQGSDRSDWSGSDSELSQGARSSPAGAEHLWHPGAHVQTHRGDLFPAHL